MKTCEECGTEYSESECPFCESEKAWKKIYDQVKDFKIIMDLSEKNIPENIL